MRFKVRLCQVYWFTSFVVQTYGRHFAAELMRKRGLLVFFVGAFFCVCFLLLVFFFFFLVVFCFALFVVCVKACSTSVYFLSFSLSSTSIPWMNVWTCKSRAEGPGACRFCMWFSALMKSWRDTTSGPLNHHGINADEICGYFDYMNLQRLMWVNVAHAHRTRTRTPGPRRSLAFETARESVTENPSLLSISGAQRRPRPRFEWWN